MRQFPQSLYHAYTHSLCFRQVPLGTVISDSDTSSILADLMSDGESCVVVRGGEGGLGNAAFASPVHRRPQEFTEGGKGEERMLTMELKTIADIGMVCIPLILSTNYFTLYPKHSPSTNLSTS